MATIDPEVGDLKTIVKFAWLPVFVCNKKIWLRRYALLYRFTVTYDKPNTRLFDYAEIYCDDEEIATTVEEARKRYELKYSVPTYSWELIEETIL